MHRKRLMIAADLNRMHLDPRSNLLYVAIDFPAMTNREQMNLVLLWIESVNDSIIADPSTVPIRSFESVVRIGR
jgi:hypothetical protein